MEKEKEFSKELFQNPTKEYRGAPFWAWNGALDKEVLRKQMDVLERMGFGGFHIHSRIGLNTEYLGEEFMDCVRFCHAYGKEKGMLTWLYDEDKWPSGYGGGFVTETKDYWARYLLFSPNLYPEGHLDRKRPASSRLTENGTVRLLASYQVCLQEGRLSDYRRLETGDGKEAEKNGTCWHAYEVIGDQLPWFNNAAYVDTMNPEAISRFTELVYEKYADCLGEEFSKTVPAIFTDEPQFTKSQTMEDGRIPQDAGIPYTKGMEEVFRKAYGYEFFDKLPELFWEKADGSFSEMKYHYHNLIAQRFADAYAGTLGKWCKEHNLMLTGHLMYEDSLERQTVCVGDAMRSYPYFQLPGIDILADAREYNTAKQAQSVSRQQGAPGVTSELYGVTNWDYDFRGHKLQGDWQAALGITTRVPHLAWMYMGGESKRDYPAPIDAHSPWYEKYPLIEDHFARVNTVLRRGKAKVRVGVLHPIESYWLIYGPDRQTLSKRKEMDEAFRTLTEWMLFGLIDFDFLSEGLLPKQEVLIRDGKLQVGEMAYEVLVIPRLLTIRESTLEILKSFLEAGGKILMLGDSPAYVDAKKSKKAEFLGEAGKIGFDREALLKELEPYRDVDVCDSKGLRTDTLIYQMRREDQEDWLFLAHGKPEEEIQNHPFLEKAQNGIEIQVKGHYQVDFLDTMTGEIQEARTEIQGEHTRIFCSLNPQDSFLFRLKKAEKKVEEKAEEQAEERAKEQAEEQEKEIPAKDFQNQISQSYLASQNKYQLEEANVLLLDQAAWSLDGASRMEKEEILKIDDQVRTLCGYRLRTDSFPQPWLTKEKPEKEHEVELAFTICSEIALDQVELAFEGDPDVKIRWNNALISWEMGDFFVDSTIHKVSLGALKAGENKLVLYIPFGENTNLEWCYLLGDFGVKISGREAVITQKPERIGFGDYAVQGFPFYGGNFIYETEVDMEEGTAELELPYYAAALLSVQLDEGEEIPVFLAPYRAALGQVKKGRHTLRIKAYGNRSNQFGQLHNCNHAERYFGPKTWRTCGKDWCYEYQLKKNGVLTAPILRIYQKGGEQDEHA